ncbi:ribbon-helix-helix protein, CopG family [Streptococcus suis]|uniref:ribbon-helix-helix protein, CopG family n=1 Tax=Streptococcus suis TaxID=1307 RepID=UPI000CF5D794|nr:ribbon-helix-helix protein, CopG family [Streptococcus suis]HEL2382903.1 ribbon-helix-helix protein, CopG family [Streptococcus suis]HEM6404390.1 ribbon-helix-helix protein, CopG family [Streptococcus suis]
MNLTAKIGRPKSENPKNRRVSVKLTEDEFKNLEEVANAKQISKSEAILQGIELLKSENKQK